MKPRYNLSNYHSLFTDFLISEDISPITLKNYRSDLKHFFGWCSKIGISGDLFENLTCELIEKYRDELNTDKTPNKTTNRRLSTIRKFCTFAIFQGWMKHNPARKVNNLSSSRETSQEPNFDLLTREDNQQKDKNIKSAILFEFEDEYPKHAKNLEDYFQIINSYPQTNG